MDEPAVPLSTAIDPAWIAAQLRRRGYSQAGLARALDRNPAAINRMLKGKRQIKADEVPLILGYLNAPIADVRPDPDPAAKAMLLLLRSSIQAGVRAKTLLAIIDDALKGRQ